MRKRILLLSNLDNGNKEDEFLAKFLSKYFPVQVSHPKNAIRHAKNADLVLVRNIWSSNGKSLDYINTLRRLSKQRKIIYNPLSAKADMYGKKYLSSLFSQGYPVIPTILSKKQLSRLKKSTNYFIKPLFGGSSYGCKQVILADIRRMNLKSHLIQSVIGIDYEISFYFIDNKLLYALKTIDNDRWNLKEAAITKQDSAFARKFVKWNNLQYGLQRIDACKTKEGSMLLMEIEDYCPYLSLLDIKPNLRNKLLNALVLSLKKQLN